MDEPLGALDKNLRYQMQVEIKEIQQRLGMTVVYVTHDQEEAMNMSDRIAIMNSGRVEQVGQPAEIYDNPSSDFIARFLGEANLVDGTIGSIREDEATLRTSRGLSLSGRSRGDLPIGAPARLFVRPERVTIAYPQGKTDVVEHGNSVDGMLVHTSFLGNILRHVVEIEPSVRMTVDVQNSSAGSVRPREGSVRLSWRIADSVILPH